MKKILTILAAFALTLSVWAQGLAPATVPLYFDTTCPGLTYEDGEPINNEVFRVLAVFNLTAGHTFELDVDGNPVELDADGNPETGAIFRWMKTPDFKTSQDDASQDYAPVTDGISGKPHTATLNLVRFSLSSSDIPAGYEMANYDVYFIMQDTRVSEGEEKRLVKWNATLIDTFGPMFSMTEYAMNFTKGTYTSREVQSDNWKYPYGVEPEPEITFPGEPSDDVKAAAIEALIAALGEDAAATVTYVTNPAVASIINGCDATVDENGVATFTYKFKVTEIAIDAEGVTVKVELGENERGETQSFAEGVTVTLVDLEGAALTDVTGVTVTDTKVEESEATVTIQVDSGDIDTLLFKAKAEKVDQTN